LTTNIINISLLKLGTGFKKLTNIGESPINRSLEIDKIKTLSVNLIDAFVV